ncbi:ISNCY family transposase [Magnetovirga frankeli]|uniref:ISNCY family transposase n=1 Tax=Magnetovirga frankeli TaxID=947516 RepID=UPI001293A47B|nr:ISNCY family transposase [gamma proteobacterium SS-5]
MRQVKNPQPHFGQVAIGDIVLDPKSRDDIPQLLRGLQYIYTTPQLRDEVFAILSQVVPRDDKGKPVSSDTGRPGLDQWSILVLGVLRLAINADYDRVHELANQHKTVRLFLGHSGWAAETEYSLGQLQDNLRLFTPEILNQINQAVVRYGHELVKKNGADEPLSPELMARCDSFVVKTHVHFPTDIGLLWDAVRKILHGGQALAKALKVKGWRQARHNQQAFKRQCHKLQKLRKSKKADAEQVELATQRLILLALSHISRAQALLEAAQTLDDRLVEQLQQWRDYAQLFADQIHRRCILGEDIPHDEKIFSIFQSHTEWISKGKAGVPQGLGLRVHIVEDQHQFILHHRVARQQTDEKLAIELVRETKQAFPNLQGVSFDKGYHSPENQRELPRIVPQVTLPKKGRRNASEQEREQSPTFQQQRRQHSAVESAINGLEQGGLDRCRDHGIDGFERYVALAVLARNIKRIGVLLRQAEKAEADRKRGPYKKRTA